MKDFAQLTKQEREQLLNELVDNNNVLPWEDEPEPDVITGITVETGIFPDYTGLTPFPEWKDM